MPTKAELRELMKKAKTERQTQKAKDILREKKAMPPPPPMPRRTAPTQPRDTATASQPSNSASDAPVANQVASLPAGFFDQPPAAASTKPSTTHKSASTPAAPEPDEKVTSGVTSARGATFKGTSEAPKQNAPAGFFDNPVEEKAVRKAAVVHESKQQLEQDWAEFEEFVKEVEVPQEDVEAELSAEVEERHQRADFEQALYQARLATLLKRSVDMGLDQPGSESNEPSKRQKIEVPSEEILSELQSSNYEADEDDPFADFRTSLGAHKPGSSSSAILEALKSRRAQSESGVAQTGATTKGTKTNEKEAEEEAEEEEDFDTLDLLDWRKKGI